MHLNQSFDAVKSRLGFSQSSGPRHTIDAILGLNGQRRAEVSRVSEFEPREVCDAVPVSPGAVESAGKINCYLLNIIWCV